MKNPNSFYTYAYLREDRSPYYIGKGSGRRIYVKGGRFCGIPKNKSQIIFLKQNLTEEEAFKHEKYMIAVFGRKDLGTGILRNMTDGGEGTSGRLKSEEEKEKSRARMIGKNNPQYGRKYTEEERKNLSEKMRGENGPFYGKTHTEEFKKNRCGPGNPMYGKKCPEHSARMKRRMNTTEGKEIARKAGKIGGAKAYERGVGIHGRSKEQIIEDGKKGAKIAQEQRWQCTITGHVSTPCGLSAYQKKRGIDTLNRIRIK
jgi:hypothetical protein